MILGIADKLRWLVETHGLGVEDRRAEDIRVIGLQPAGGIDQQSERGGMAFGKAVFAETLDLLEAALGEILR